jgi:hypothetical protein
MNKSFLGLGLVTVKFEYLDTPQVPTAWAALYRQQYGNGYNVRVSEEVANTVVPVHREMGNVTFYVISKDDQCEIVCPPSDWALIMRKMNHQLTYQLEPRLKPIYELLTKHLPDGKLFQVKNKWNEISTGSMGSLLHTAMQHPGCIFID